MTRIGSLFSGAGGLDIAIESLLDAETAWHCELDAAASKVLAARWPGVPNLGDITAVDWAAVEPVDVLAGGFPCQDVSAAGRRAGMGEGTRSGLWAQFARAIDVLHPRAVVIENVRGLLTINAGEGKKGIDVVFDDLAKIGYSARWMVLPASYIGAPHRRDRVFIVARPTADVLAPERVETPKGLSTDLLLPTPMARQSGNTPENHLRKKPGRTRVTDLAILVENNLLTTGGLLPTPRARDSKGNDAPGRHGGMGLANALELLPTPSANDSTGAGVRGEGGINLRQAATLYGTPDWGRYAAAVSRWETLTRPAPYPVEPNKNGRPRLVAAFSEWMMGWPAGWVTDLIPTRTHALRIIGNGVVAHQAEAALRILDLPALVG